MKYSNTLKHKVNTLMAWSIILTVGFVAGIPSIVFGAITPGLKAVMVLGIIFTAVGFYVMPVLWIMYGDCRAKLNIYNAIVYDHLTDVQVIASNFAMSEKSATGTVRWLISKRYLTGVVFDGKTISTIEPQTSDVLRCVYCGTIVRDKTLSHCPNCNGRLEKYQEK